MEPVLGIDFRIGAKQQFVALAQDNLGFLEINQFLSHHLHNKTNIPDRAPAFEHAFVIYPFRKAIAFSEPLRQNELVGIGMRDLNRLRFMLRQAQHDRPVALSLTKGETNKLVALNPFSFFTKTDFNTHRLLRAIDNNTLLTKLVVEEQGSIYEIFIPPAVLKQYYKDFPHIIKNTEQLLERCSIHFRFDEQRPSQNLKTYAKTAQEDINLIKQLCNEGLQWRYGKPTPQIKARLKKELSIIQQQEYVSFFLINWDIVQYAKRKGYFHVGRGSGANSIVAYLLGITDVDPIELDLYFERFMNLYRKNPPDFDIDFSSRERDDVTRYIFERFGQKEQAALLATYNTYGHKAAVRELGKVFGLPNHEIDILSAGKYNKQNLDKVSDYVDHYAKYIQGIPNYLSIHAGGILISDKAINYFTATDIPPKGFPTTQFDMHIAEDVGLFKYDILGQRGLGKIKDALAIIKKNKPDAPDIDIHNAQPFIEDEKVNAMVRRADCIGCFYVESPAMRMLLKKLEVDDYLGLVAASSIIRPGVAKSGMMREYILRKKNPDRRKDAHPEMQKLMPETFGIMVYQEDVIKVAHLFAGLTLGEADVLRRGMSGKFRSREEFRKAQNQFFINCRKKGIEERTTHEIWMQIESFAGYAFAKGHSASYAVESYQSLFLKTYYPLEYMVAVLNNGGGFYRPEVYIHEARRLGAHIHVPHINRSNYRTVIYGDDIYLGFQHLKSLERKVAAYIERDREHRGPFTSLDDFVERVPIGIEQLDILIRAGAFDILERDRRALLWEAYHKLNHNPPRVLQQRLFKTPAKHFELPVFAHSRLENMFDQLELMGFTLYDPFALLQKPLPEHHLLAKDLAANIGKVVTLYGYLVTIKNTATSKGKGMNFGTFLDQSGEWIDTVHFPPVAARYPFRGRGIYRLTGKVVEEFDFVSLEIISQERLAYVPDARYAADT